MKEKISTILKIAIIGAVLIIAGSIFYHYAIYLPKEERIKSELVGQQKFKEIEELQKQKEELEKQSAETKEKDDEETQRRIAELEQQIATLENKDTEAPQPTPQPTSQPTLQPAPQPVQQEDNRITASDYAEYLSGVVKITCSFEPIPGLGGNTNYAYGSASLWSFPDNPYMILTNKHITDGRNKCQIFAGTSGWYDLTGEITAFNTKTDVALSKITPYLPEHTDTKPVSTLNYSISSLPRCSPIMLIGSPIIIVGFPASGGSVNRIITEGIISGIDNSPFMEDLKFSNYFISAKIDAGNSGGIAFSKENGKLCVLGIPTWASIGKYEIQGIIQNIHSVFYKE